MERVVVEYLANALWQLPVLAAGAWLLLRMWEPGPAAQHWIWLAVLGLGLVLPLRGAVPAAASVAPAMATSPATTFSGTAFDSVGEPGGFVLGQQTDGAQSAEWADFVSAAFSDCVRRVSVSAAAARWIVGIWLAVMLLGLVRLAGAWRAARRLVAESRAVALRDREQVVLEECARRIGVAAPEVRESDGIAGPVVVGAFAPVLLWPDSFRRSSDDELRAVLCHELAHLRRRDYGMNLVCEAAVAPLKWHPAAHGVGRRIRATREMACDAMAAAAMDSGTVYAECLVRLARSIAGGGVAAGSVAAGLFNGNVMEERVMRLMRGRIAMSWRTRLVRGAAGVAAMMAAIAVAGMFHVAPAMAQGVGAAVRSPGWNAVVVAASQAVPL
ncbi:MAG: M56 family metallopeptidase, partial [Acidobacteriaceae bacterium]